MRPLFTLIVLASFALLVGCNTKGNERAKKIATLQPDLQAGAALYATHCSRCHGADGKSGTQRSDVVKKLERGDEVVVSIILNGVMGMTAFDSVLSDQETADLLGYFKTLK